MAKNSFRLGIHSSSHYLSLFRENAISIEPAIEGPRTFPAQGMATIGEGHLAFELYMPIEHGGVAERHIELARSVLARIVDMDDAARAIPDATEHDELLAYVTIRDSDVELTYFATTVNTEWSGYFTAADAGQWECRGFTRP